MSEKLSIINLNYVYEGSDMRLKRAEDPEGTPWIVLGPYEIREKFTTHAEAIQYADKLSREPK
jgi:hypothetical protein